MQVIRLDHITILARDPERSIRFYIDVLGLEPDCEWPGEITMLRAGETSIAIAHWGKGKNFNARAGGVDHFAFRVDSDTYQRARQYLASKEVPIDHESDHGINQSLYFPDPDGNLLELACYEIPGHESKMPMSLKRDTVVDRD